MNRCLECNKEISDKAKYCSEAHSKAYRRRTKAGHEPGQNDPILQPGQARTGLTRTDALFSEDAGKRGLGLDYYNFSGKVFRRGCLALDCDKDFQTHLKLLKFCSPDCMRETLNKLTV